MMYDNKRYVGVTDCLCHWSRVDHHQSSLSQARKLLSQGPLYKHYINYPILCSAGTLFELVTIVLFYLIQNVLH